jgi:hypothetical protein
MPIKMLINAGYRVIPYNSEQTVRVLYLFRILESVMFNLMSSIDQRTKLVGEDRLELLMFKLGSRHLCFCP